MATQSDLTGVIIEVTDQLRQWLSGELRQRDRPAPEGPCMAKAWYRLPGGTTFELVAELPIAAGQLNAENLGEALEHEIASSLGSAPTGHLRIKIWETGRAHKSGIDLQRSLKGVDGDGDVAVVLLKSILFRMFERAEKSESLMQQHAAAAITGMTAMAEHNTKLATQRTVSASAADLGSPWAWLGIAALIIGYPVLKRQLGLRSEATIVEVARTLTKTFDDVSRQVGRTPTVPGTPTIRPPEGAAQIPEGAEAEALAVPEHLEHLRPLFEALRNPTEVTMTEFGNLASMASTQGLNILDAFTLPDTPGT